MNRKALACLGIVLTLLFSLAGQQAFALCIADDHRAIEVVGHAPCGPAAHGETIADGSPCTDMVVGVTLEASLQQPARDAAHADHTPTDGGAALETFTRMPWPRALNTRWRTATVIRDHRLQARRTVVLLI